MRLAVLKLPGWVYLVAVFFSTSHVFGQTGPCSTAVPLVCGVGSNYSLTGVGVWDPPGPWGTPGNEAVFTYVPPVTGIYDIQVTNNNYYVDLFYASSCGPNGWTYLNDIFANETSSINLTAGAAYYFLIDDENLTTSSGSISISCPCIPPLGGVDQTLQITTPSVSLVSTTFGACNDCNFRSSNDRVIEIEVLCAGDYVFSLCNQASWDTYLYLSDQPCGGNVIAENDDACGLQSSFSASLDLGIYYIEVEGYAASSQGSFDLEISTTCNFTPLPVELAYFQGENRGRENHLTWQTITELNNDYFVLERSQDGQDFVEIAKVSGMGTTNSPTNYMYIDEAFTIGVNYYRLRQVDFDGHGEVFNTVALAMELNEPLILFPNPARNVVQLNSNGQLITPLITIQNALGKMVHKEWFASGDSFSIELSQPPGVYLVSIMSGTEVITKKMVIE